MLKIAHDLLYKHLLKENHRFPMIKYEMIPEQLMNTKVILVPFQKNPLSIYGQKVKSQIIS